MTRDCQGHRGKRPYLSATALDQALTAGQADARADHALYGRIFIHVNLNTASKDEILLIPGVGQRMLHEFEEYRPYAALAVFHREIDKYVDDTELARLEQYVFVPIDLNTASDADILTIPGMGNRMLREFRSTYVRRRHRALPARDRNASARKKSRAWSASIGK